MGVPALARRIDRLRHVTCTYPPSPTGIIGPMRGVPSALLTTEKKEVGMPLVT